MRSGQLRNCDALCHLSSSGSRGVRKDPRMNPKYSDAAYKDSKKGHTTCNNLHLVNVVYCWQQGVAV